MKKQSWNEQFSLMDNFIVQTFELTCTKCGKTGYDLSRNIVEAIKSFMNKRWRVTKKHCYCPECADKYFKTQITAQEFPFGGSDF